MSDANTAVLGCAADVVVTYMSLKDDVVAFAATAVALRVLFQPDDEFVEPCSQFGVPECAAAFLEGKGPLPVAAVNKFRKWLSLSLQVVWTSQWSLRKVVLCGMAVCRARHGTSCVFTTPNYINDACRCLESWISRVSGGNVLAFHDGLSASASLSALVPVINGATVVSRRGLRAATRKGTGASAPPHAPADPVILDLVMPDDTSPVCQADSEVAADGEGSRSDGLPAAESVTLNHVFIAAGDGCRAAACPRSLNDAASAFRMYRYFRSMRAGDTLGSGTYGTVVVQSCGMGSLCATKEPRLDRKPARLSPALARAEAAVLVPAHIMLAELGRLQVPPPVPRSRTSVVHHVCIFVWSAVLDATLPDALPLLPYPAMLMCRWCVCIARGTRWCWS